MMSAQDAVEEEVSIVHVKKINSDLNFYYNKLSATFLMQCF